MLGIDSRTFDIAASPLASAVFRVPFRRQVVEGSGHPRNPHCKALGDLDGDGLPDVLAASSDGWTGLFWYDAAAGWQRRRIAPGNFSGLFLPCSAGLDWRARNPASPQPLDL